MAWGRWGHWVWNEARFRLCYTSVFCGCSPMSNLLLTIVVWAVPVLLAITLHEAAHGYAARHFGDPTAYLAGRISLNPLRHIDPVGTVLIPLAMLLMGSMSGANIGIFGWAKPVPVVFARLRHPRQDMLWVAAAGPAANLVQAFGWGWVLALQHALGGFGGPYFYQMGIAGITVNISLTLLNLLPIPPLDGGRIAISLLPKPLARQFAGIEPFGFPILLALMYLGVLNIVLSPIADVFRKCVTLVTGA